MIRYEPDCRPQPVMEVTDSESDDDASAKLTSKKCRLLALERPGDHPESVLQCLSALVCADCKPTSPADTLFVQDGHLQLCLCPPCQICGGSQ